MFIIELNALLESKRKNKYVLSIQVSLQYPQHDVAIKDL